MSLISKQIRILRELAVKNSGTPNALFWKRCADTIEELSAKLAVANMERSTAYYNGGWIPCSERLPKPEEEVIIHAKRKCRGGDTHDIIAMAMYEDGTIREHDSTWSWYDLDGDWDEEEDCYIIPEGWWENNKYRRDEDYNNPVDDEVIAWMSLPEPYKPKGE